MVAIKKFREPLANRTNIKRVIREIKIATHFTDHANFAPVFDIMVDPPDMPEFEDVYMVTCLFDARLSDVIQTNHNLNELHYKCLLYQTLRAIKCMHSANLIRHGLKPSSLIVNSSCDLALDSLESRDSLNTSSDDLFYMAPELLFGDCVYGKAVDIWSVGCIFCELITRVPFFKGVDPSHQLKVILSKVECPSNKQKLSFIKNKCALNTVISHSSNDNTVTHFGFNFPDGTSYLMLDLLKKMLQFCPEDRITADNALNHPFLQQLHSQAPVQTCPVPFTYNLNLPYSKKKILESLYCENFHNQELSISRKALEASKSTEQISSSGISDTSKEGMCSSYFEEYSEMEGAEVATPNTEKSAKLNLVIDEMLRKEARLAIIEEVMKYRPVSRQMIAFVAYASDKYDL